MEFVVILVLVIIAVAVGVTKARNDQINRSWADVAENFGLSFRPATLNVAPYLTGNMDGRPVTVDIHKKGAGQHKNAWTRFRIGMPSLGLGLKLKSEGFFDGINKAFGAQDIEVGDAAFDGKVFVKGHSEAAVRDFLTPGRRRTVERFLSSFTGAVITDDEIVLSSRGYVRSSSELMGAIDAMLQVARSLADDQGQVVEAGSGFGQDPQPASAQTEVASSAMELEGVDTPATGADVFAAEDAGLALEAEAAAQPEPEPEPEPEGGDAAVSAAAGTEAVAPAVADTVAVNEFCDAVFAPGALSFASTKAFQEAYEGQRVAWSGTLESSAPFSFDFDFGSGGGVKAVLVIRSTESGVLGNRDVKAVIGLPAAAEGLEDRVGQQVSFAGTLKKVDGFARKVFVADAELGD